MKRIFSILFIGVVVVSLMMIPAALVGASPGLVGEWLFDEGSGTTASDSSGNGNTGTLTNGPTWVDGKFGTALEFDGMNDYVEILDDPSQQITTNQITVSAWIKLNANVGATQRRIINKQQALGICWGLEVFGDGYWGSDGNQLTFHDSNGSGWHNCMTPTDLNLNQWYHVAVTDNAGEIKIYINGELDHVDAGGYGIPSSIIAPIYIGTSGGSWFFFSGIIDEVRIYDEALSADQIAALASLVIEVEIDIKPGSYPNSVNLNDHGAIPVAILGSADFDVTKIAPETVSLEGMAVKARGKSNKLLAHLEDVNEDGWQDLVVQIEDDDGDMAAGQTEATVSGFLKAEFGGTAFQGSDSINIVKITP